MNAQGFRDEWNRRLRASPARFVFVQFAPDLENHMRVGYAFAVQRWGWVVACVSHEGMLIDTQARSDA